jgi:hypothetical protein
MLQAYIMSHMRATCPALLVILDFITLIILSDNYALQILKFLIVLRW